MRTRRSSGCVDGSGNWPPNINRPAKSPSRSHANSPDLSGPRCNRWRPDEGKEPETRVRRLRRVGHGRRRRRMIQGTMVRISEIAMRQRPRLGLARLDSLSSRRSTVMCALLRATAVTTVYQRDSSSKRPRSSVVSAGRAPQRPRAHVARTVSRASRPEGGAFGAPGHRAHHVSRGCYAAS